MKIKICIVFEIVLTCGTKYVLQASNMSSRDFHIFVWHLDWMVSLICRHNLPSVKINYVIFQWETIMWLFQGNNSLNCSQCWSTVIFIVINRSGGQAKAALWESWLWSEYFSLFWALSHVCVPQAPSHQELYCLFLCLFHPFLGNKASRLQHKGTCSATCPLPAFLHWSLKEQWEVCR